MSNEEILKMNEAGMSVQAIAEEMGVTVAVIYKALREADKKPHSKKVLSLEVEAGVLEKYIAGREPVYKIAREFGITYNQLYDLLRKGNIDTRAEADKGGAELALDVAIDMYQKNYSVREIRLETGISTFKLYEELGRRSIPLKREKKHEA